MQLITISRSYNEMMLIKKQFLAHHFTFIHSNLTLITLLFSMVNIYLQGIHATADWTASLNES
jgi:hypothetical protein